jgi:hypothetical protein
MSDWEDWADEEKEVEDNTTNNNKFANEALVDEEKEERETKIREEEQKRVKTEIDNNKKEKKKDEKDYEKIYNDRFDKAGAIKNLTREEIATQNPDFSEEKINEMLSKQAEEKIGDTLFEDDTAEESKKVDGLISKISELKGEKNYKAFGKEVAEYIVSNGQSHNHIPKFFSELFHALSDKITVVKMRSIVTDFDARLKKRKDEEDRKAAEAKKLNTDTKKSKGKKKATLGGVTKALDTNKMMMDDMFGNNGDDGEGEYDDYGNEGDGYVDYGRDDIDFI